MTFGVVALMLNGNRIDMDELLTVQITEIDAIDVFRTLAGSGIFGIGIGANMVINITTRLADDEDEDSFRYNFTTINPLGYQPAVEFYSPKYDTPESKYSSNPDYRTTIFWKPDITVTESGKASFEFYTSDFPTTYSVVIEGISNRGKIIRHVDKIVVE